MKNILKITLLAGFIISIISCQKEWLNKKSSSSLTVPVTLRDFQGLLDNTSSVFGTTPNLIEMSSDDYYLDYSVWNNLSIVASKRGYIWDKDLFGGITTIDWQRPYSQIFYSNIVLDGLNSPDYNDDKSGLIYDNVKGSATFFRALAFFNLAQGFAKPYDSNNSSVDLGIPLRLTADLNESIRRASVEETYKQIIKDLEISTTLLPNTQQYNTRPNKAAAYALLSRVYLSMRKYNDAMTSADKSLKINSSLLDFNTLSTGTSFPIPSYQTNLEVLYYQIMPSGGILAQPTLLVDPAVYQMYESNDLRKTLFFAPQGVAYTFRGSYTSSGTRQSGSLTTAEMFLNRAEGYARTGDIQKAMDDLNFLRSYRYNKSLPRITLTASTKDQALTAVLSERRKELIFRGLRWVDLRRLNLEGANITINRNLNGQIYTLPPNDPRYIFPIPDEVIQMSGIQQNIR